MTRISIDLNQIICSVFQGKAKLKMEERDSVSIPNRGSKQEVFTRPIYKICTTVILRTRYFKHFFKLFLSTIKGQCSNSSGVIQHNELQTKSKALWAYSVSCYY